MGPTRETTKTIQKLPPAGCVSETWHLEGSQEPLYLRIRRSSLVWVSFDHPHQVEILTLTGSPPILLLPLLLSSSLSAGIGVILFSHFLDKITSLVRFHRPFVGCEGLFLTEGIVWSEFSRGISIGIVEYEGFLHLHETSRNLKDSFVGGRDYAGTFILAIFGLN